MGYLKLSELTQTGGEVPRVKAVVPSSCMLDSLVQAQIVHAALFTVGLELGSTLSACPQMNAVCQETHVSNDMCYRAKSDTS